jgi:hypothetical protein
LFFKKSKRNQVLVQMNFQTKKHWSVMLSYQLVPVNLVVDNPFYLLFYFIENIFYFFFVVSFFLFFFFALTFFLLFYLNIKSTLKIYYSMTIKRFFFLIFVFILLYLYIYWFTPNCKSESYQVKVKLICSFNCTN